MRILLGLVPFPEYLAELLNDAVLAEPLDDVGADGARGRPRPA